MQGNLQVNILQQHFYQQGYRPLTIEGIGRITAGQREKHELWVADWRQWQRRQLERRRLLQKEIGVRKPTNPYGEYATIYGKLRTSRGGGITPSGQMVEGKVTIDQRI